MGKSAYIRFFRKTSFVSCSPFCFTRRSKSFINAVSASDLQGGDFTFSDEPSSSGMASCVTLEHCSSSSSLTYFDRLVSIYLYVNSLRLRTASPSTSTVDNSSNDNLALPNAFLNHLFVLPSNLSNMPPCHGHYQD